VSRAPPASVGADRDCLPKLGILVRQSLNRRQRWRRPRTLTDLDLRTLLRYHAHHLWAADELGVPTLRFKMLYVLVLIVPGRRELQHVNVTANPTAASCGGLALTQSPPRSRRHRQTPIASRVEWTTPCLRSSRMSRTEVLPPNNRRQSRPACAPRNHDRAKSPHSSSDIAISGYQQPGRYEQRQDRHTCGSQQRPLARHLLEFVQNALGHVNAWLIAAQQRKPTMHAFLPAQRRATAGASRGVGSNFARFSLGKPPECRRLQLPRRRMFHFGARESPVAEDP
jgi:hypothetical protein